MDGESTFKNIFKCYLLLYIPIIPHIILKLSRKLRFYSKAVKWNMKIILYDNLDSILNTGFQNLNKYISDGKQ